MLTCLVRAMLEVELVNQSGIDVVLAARASKVMKCERRGDEGVRSCKLLPAPSN